MILVNRMNKISIQVTHIIERCKDCPFYEEEQISYQGLKPIPLDYCNYWRTHKMEVNGEELSKQCDLLDGDKFVNINGELFKG